MLNTIKSRLSLKEAVCLEVEEYVPQALTFAELVAAYDIGVCGDAGQRLAKWVDVLGDHSAWEITPEDLSRVMRAMTSRCAYAPSSANRDLSTIGTVFRWAVARRISPRGFKSPSLGAQRFKEDLRRVFATDDEIDGLRRLSLAYKDRRFGVFIHLLLDSGARKSELLARRWCDVNLDRMEIHLETSKNGNPRLLHFSPATRELLLRVYPNRDESRLLFEGRVPDQPINYRAAWRKLTREIGRSDIHLHDSRHFLAARMIATGTPIAVVAQTLGNSAEVVARRYGHLETNTLRKAVEAQWTQQPMAPSSSR